EQEIAIDFDSTLDAAQYAFICFAINEKISLAYTPQRVTGLLSVFNGKNKAVSNNGKQEPLEGTGVDSFEFWCPQRRPEGQNITVELSKPLDVFQASNVRNGTDRPTTEPTAWVASAEDKTPTLELLWNSPQTIKKMVLVFDT